MKLGLFGRMLAIYALVFIVGAVSVEYYIGNAVRDNYIERLDEGLVRQASVISGLVSDKTIKRAGGPASLDELSRSLKQKTGARVTIIASDGRVLGDSDRDSLSMDNHMGRPEVKEALHAGSGMSIRKSETLKEDLLYTALRISEGEDVAGFVRLALPLGDVNADIDRLRVKLLLVVGIVLLSVGVFSTGQIVRLRMLTRQISDFTASLAGGDFEKRLFFEGAGEFGEIAANLNEMASELKTLMSKSAEEKDRLNVILRSMPDALLVMDSRGAISLASAASRSFFGSRESITGRPFVEVVRSPEFFSMMEESGKSRGPVEGEAKLGEKHLMIRVSPLPYPQGFIAVFHDMTEARRLEQTRKDFVANVSHEIKTPVAAIKGFADTLLEGAIEDRETAVRFIRTIKSNSERLNSLVDDLMTISKLELGVIKIEKAEIDPSEAIDAVCATLGESAARKGLYLRTSITPGIGRITADRDRLIQVLTNLIDNAIKFTDAGGVTVGADMEEGGAFLFVEDTGMGIPGRHLPRLGERFYRVDASRSRKLGGTGLGLAIVKHILRAHGWRMEIESQEGKGTRVRVFVT